MTVEAQDPKPTTPVTPPTQAAGPPLEALAEAAANRPTPGRERGANGRFVPRQVENRESSIEKINGILNNAQQTSQSPIPDAPEAEDDDDLEGTADESQLADEASPPVDPAAPSGEGLLEELRQLATAVGVSQAVVDMAKSEDALRIAIAMAAPDLNGNAPPAPQPQATRPQPQPPGDEPLFDEDLRIKFLLDADSADPEDPYFKQAKHTTDTISDLQDVVSMLAEKVLGYEKRETNVRRSERQKQFDDVLDATDWQIVGKTANLKPKSVELQARMALYPAYERIIQAMPNLTPQRAVELAHEQVFSKPPAPKQTTKEAARIAALKASNAKILGSGSGGPPAPERPLSPRERFERKFNQLTGGRP